MYSWDLAILSLGKFIDCNFMNLMLSVITSMNVVVMFNLGLSWYCLSDILILDDILTHNEFLVMSVLYMWVGCLYAAMMSSIPMFNPEDEVCNHERAYLFHL